MALRFMRPQMLDHLGVIHGTPPVWCFSFGADAGTLHYISATSQSPT
jgi:hypothetical protein